MKIAILISAAAVLTACASTAPQYYSLQAPGITTGAAQTHGSSTGPSKTDLQAKYAISVQPVVVPEEVSRPQIVVSTAQDAEVIPLNAALWSAPLEAQLRTVLGDALARRLNVLDVGQSGAVQGLPLWRIYVDVQRFDSVYGESAQQHVVWRMVPQGMPAGTLERVCSAQVRVPVGTGMSALVQGHRQALEMVATAIAQALPRADAGRNSRASARGAGAYGEGTVVSGNANSGTLQFRGCVG